MHALSAHFVNCLERERLAEELGEARTRGRNLSRLRPLTVPERTALEQRESQAHARLMEHDAQHRCQP